jgi:peptide/nickel transport system permease protein
MHGTIEFWLRFKTYRVALVGLAIVICTIILGLFAPFFAPTDPFMTTDEPLTPPNNFYLMGTDDLGRDVFSRIIYGSRVSLLFAFGAASISLLIGIVLGSIPGYYGGWIDDVFSRFFEIFLMIPQLILIIIIVFLFGTNILFSLTIVGLTLWPTNAKIVRAQVMSLKSREYVQAAQIAGASDFRILFVHIIPNGVYPVVANSTLQMAQAIIIEASLSFLGLGDLNFVSWGQILRSGLYHLTSAWWLPVFSGLAIAILVVGFNLVGDGVSIALNPRLRER